MTDSEALWKKTLSSLSANGVELQTLKDGLWFLASARGNRIIIGNAAANTPSCTLDRLRQVLKTEFIFVHSFYDRWLDGETGISEKIREKSKNSTYILAMIKHFSD